MSPKLVIFDCDGTIIDSQQRIVAAMNLAYEANGQTPPNREETLSIVGLSLLQAMDVLSPDLAPDIRARIAMAYKDAFADMRRRKHMEAPLYDGAEAVIRSLGARDDIIMGIATGKSRRGVDAFIESHAFEGLFHTIQTADEHPSKPHPSMIYRCFDDTGIDAAGAVMIGDTRFDMEMAKAACTRAIGVDWGYHPVDELKQSGADHIVSHFNELEAVVDRMIQPEGGAL